MMSHAIPDAQSWAQTVLEALDTPFPWQSQHISANEGDCDVTPWGLHPVFHGSLDWHSSCHMQLSGLLLLEHAAASIAHNTQQELLTRLTQRLTAENLEVERTYLAAHPSYERPYGWGWVVKLAGAAKRSHVPQARQWAHDLEALVDVVAENLLLWLPKLMYPVRTGQHDNTAFGLLILREGFESLNRQNVVDVIDAHARRLFAEDVAYPSHYEPSGNDFLSAALSEAELMRHVMAEQEFAAWLRAFLPNLAESGDNLCEPLRVSDTSDGKLVHLFGLELSRAASLRALRPYLTEEAQSRIDTVTAEQQERARAQIADGHFMSTHWLVTFAVRTYDLR